MNKANAFKLAERAVAWHEGRLPAGIAPSYFDLVVQCAAVPDIASGRVVFHTYVCLDPEGSYVAVEVRPGYSLSTSLIREVIDTFTPSADTINRQAEIAKQYMVDSDEKLWLAAHIACQKVGLPIAFMAFGQTQPGAKLVAIQRSVIIAPLLKVRDVFRSTRPRKKSNWWRPQHR